jgi:hypothetical protein
MEICYPRLVEFIRGHAVSSKRPQEANLFAIFPMSVDGYLDKRIKNRKKYSEKKVGVPRRGMIQHGSLLGSVNYLFNIRIHFFQR